MENKKVNIDIQKNEEGHWLLFKDSNDKEALINVENYFDSDSIVHSCIRQWAEDQFKPDVT